MKYKSRSTDKSSLNIQFDGKKCVNTYHVEMMNTKNNVIMDVRTPKAYGLFLRGCFNVMDEIYYISELNMPANMLMLIIKKFPYKLRWLVWMVACDIQKRLDHRATFS